MTTYYTSQVLSDGSEVLIPSDTSAVSEDLIQHLENVEFNQVQIFYGLQALCSSVNTLLLVVLVITAFKLIWTAVAKWLFGGV